MKTEDADRVFEVEEFTGKKTRSPSAPLVSIQKRGVFSLNRAAYEILGEPTHVKLLFDRNKQVIGIRAADPEELGAYTVRKQKRAANYLFTGIAFANTYGIDIGYARRYRGEPHDDMLIVDLNQEPMDASWPPKERDEYGRIAPA